PSEARGFSGYARSSGPRLRPKGLPDPTLSSILPTQSQDVPRRALVAVQLQPAARADVGPHTERLLYPLRAEGPIGEHARTVLTHERRRHGYGSLKSVCCFEIKAAQERPPRHVADALGDGVVPEQVGRLQILVVDDVELTHERQRALVVEVLALPA